MDQEEGTRLEAFRQLKVEIRRAGEYLIGGIDVAKGRQRVVLQRDNRRAIH